MHQSWINALIGGSLIGVSVSLFLLVSGRVAGISGIVYGALSAPKGERLWRGLFIIGLILGGLVLNAHDPDFFADDLSAGSEITIVAGLLVGFGTTIGSGCTSGHGICGISRMSPRSLVATIVFIIAGALTVAVVKKTFGLI